MGVFTEMAGVPQTLFQAGAEVVAGAVRLAGGLYSFFEGGEIVFFYQWCLWSWHLTKCLWL